MHFICINQLKLFTFLFNFFISSISLANCCISVLSGSYINIFTPFFSYPLTSLSFNNKSPAAFFINILSINKEYENKDINKFLGAQMRMHGYGLDAITNKKSFWP